MSITPAEPPVAAEPWEQRLRASAIPFSQIAIDAPGTGIVSTNVTGQAQIHRWDTTTGQLTQLTSEPTPARPVERYVERLRDRGHPVEIEWFDAGHVGGAADDELAVRHQRLMLEFAERVAAEGQALG